MNLINLKIIFPACILFTLTGVIQAQQNTAGDLAGKYFGEVPPGMTAKLFAKGIVSSDSLEHSSPAISPDGKTIIWTVIYRYKPAFLLESKNQNAVWTDPSPPSFSYPGADDFYPSFSADGKTLYFSSRRPMPPGYPPTSDMRIWIVNKTARGWGQAVPFDTTVSRGEEYAHSVSKNGSIYFSFRRDGGRTFDIAFSKKIKTGYTKPQPLPAGVNTTYYEDGPFIAPDESYLIFESGRPEGIEGSIDLYICFRQKDGTWTNPKNMGPKINTKFAERFAKVSPDGKYLFFGSNKGGDLFDIYWISAKIIDDLK